MLKYFLISLFLWSLTSDLSGQLDIRFYNSPFIENSKIKYSNARYTVQSFKVLQQTSKYKNINFKNFHFSLSYNIKNNWHLGLNLGVLQNKLFSEYNYKKHSLVNEYLGLAYSYIEINEIKTSFNLFLEKRFLKRKQMFINADIGIYRSKTTLYKTSNFTSLLGNADINNAHSIENRLVYVPMFGFHMGYTLFNGPLKLVPTLGYNFYARIYYSELSNLYDVNLSSQLSLFDVGLGVQYTIKYH